MLRQNDRGYCQSYLQWIHCLVFRKLHNLHGFFSCPPYISAPSTSTHENVIYKKTCTSFPNENVHIRFTAVWKYIVSVIRQKCKLLLQENKASQIFRKTNIFTPWRRTCVCLSWVKKCVFFRNIRFADSNVTKTVHNSKGKSIKVGVTRKKWLLYKISSLVSTTK